MPSLAVVPKVEALRDKPVVTASIATASAVLRLLNLEPVVPGAGALLSGAYCGTGGINMRAVQLTAFGNPVDGLKYVDIPEPDAPGPNQVLIGVEFSPINPNDLMVAQGIYAFRPPLPTVIGNEGVGRVLAVGPVVESVRLGDRVLRS